MNFSGKNIFSIALISFAISVSIVSLVFAQGLVPCGPTSMGFKAECTTCDFYELINNIINFVILKIAPALVVVMIVTGAFFLIMAGGSETAIKKGKDIITAAIIGFLIIVSAWLIVDVILKNLVTGDISGSWYNIQCEKPPEATRAEPSGEMPETPEQAPITALSNGAYSAEDARSELNKNGIFINHSNECAPGQTSGCTSLEGIRQSTIVGVEKIKENCNCNVTITGGTEGGHAGGLDSISHGAGYKVDLRFNAGIDKYVHDQIGIPNPPINGTWKGKDGNIYHYEVDHWDIVVKH